MDWTASTAHNLTGDFNMELKLGQFVTDTSGKTWIIDEIDTDTDGEITYWATDADGETTEIFLECLVA